MTSTADNLNAALQSFCAIIPARLASTRLPNKVLADIHGEPMVIRVAQKAKQAGIGRVVIATDHEAVAAMCKEKSIECVVTGEANTGSDRLAMAVMHLGLSDETMVINVQGDEPLIDPSVIWHTCAALYRYPEPCATAVGRIINADDMFNPNVVKCVMRGIRQTDVDHTGLALYFSRAPLPWIRGVFPNKTGWSADFVAYRHYGIYAFRAGFLRQYPTLPESPLERWESLEQLRILDAGYAIRTAIIECEPKPAVDTAEDLEKVRALYRP